jgi:subtilisin family serine protease
MAPLSRKKPETGVEQNMKIKRTFAGALSLILTLLCLIPAAGASAPAEAADISRIPALLQAAPYLEGSVIAGFRDMTEEGLAGAFDPASGLRAEALLEVSAESLGLAGEEGTVLLAEVRSDSLTTEELLYLLAEDPRVACAEPNYQTEPMDDGEGLSGSGSPSQPMTPFEYIPLLTQYEWYLSDQSNMRDVPLDGQEPHSSVNAVPSISNLDGSAPNMTGAPVYVALIDEFADWQNPDLQPVMCRFTEAEQAALGCGEWGYNASDYNGGGQGPDDFMPGEHGSHCAGLIGAHWDGHGISGAASNVKILSIQVSDPVPVDHDDPFAHMPMVIASMVRAYAFIGRYNSYYQQHDPGKVIRLISMSLGCNMSNRTINAAVYELGRRYGTVTLVAAGNDARNNDTFLDAHGALRQNPYAIVVAAHDQSGNLSSFTNYGAETVTLSSPGTNMLSTLPVGRAAYFPGLIKNGGYEDIFCEQFDSGYDKNKLEIVQYDEGRINDNCTLTSGNGPRWSGRHAVALKIDQSMLEPDVHEEGTLMTSFRVTISLTQDQVDQITVPVTTPTGDLSAQLGFIFAGRDLKMDSDAVQVYLESDPERIVLPRLERKDTHGTASWSVIGTGPSEYESANLYALFPETYTPQAEKLVIEITVRTSEKADYFYFDTFAIGINSVPYTIYDGTSMATPTAAGIGAVLASRHPEEDGMQLAARIRASLVPNSDMQQKLQAGGRLDLTRDQSGSWVTPGAAKPSWALWEVTHPLLTGTGQPYIPDEIGDHETAGCFAELDGKLWYMPSILCEKATRLEAFCSDRIWCFNPAANAWETENTATIRGGALAGASMCVWDGELWVCGMQTIAVPDDYSILDDEGEMKLRILSYNPETRVWREHSTAGVSRPAAMILFSDDNGLMLFDNRTNGYPDEPQDMENAVIYYYDPSTGLGGKAAELPDAVMDAQIATHGTVTFVLEMAEKAASCRLYRVEGGKAEQLDVTFPEFLVETNPTFSGRVVRTLAPALNPYYLSPAAGDEALYLVGYMDKDKKADTWVLPYGSTTLQPYGKYLTTLRSSSASAVFYDGKLYGIATDWGENDSRVFRSTRVEGVEPTPTPTPTPTPAPTTKPIPKTGDSANPLLWLMLALLGLIGMASLALVTKCIHKKRN